MIKIILFTTLFWLTGFQPQIPDLTPKNLWSVLKSSGVQHPEIVFGQAMLESAALKSRLAVRNNNIFGMKLPKYRETTASGERGGYANYAHWLQSVEDYILYQKQVTKGKTVSKSEYVRIIARGYSETGDYVSRVNRVIRENSHILN